MTVIESDTGNRVDGSGECLERKHRLAELMI